jgi:hypothetical protein
MMYLNGFSHSNYNCQKKVVALFYDVKVKITQHYYILRITTILSRTLLQKSYFLQNCLINIFFWQKVYFR